MHELELASLVAPLSRDDADARAVFVPPGADGDVTPAVSLVRLDERLSLLAVNAAIREEDEAPLAAAVLALAADCGHLLIAGALRVDTDAPLEVELGGESSDETRGGHEALATKSGCAAAEDARRRLGGAVSRRARHGARATGVFVPGHRVACLGSLGDGTPSATEAEATRTTHALGEAVARKLNELDRSDRSADVFENAYRYDAAAAGRFPRGAAVAENAGAPARADRECTPSDAW